MIGAAPRSRAHRIARVGIITLLVIVFAPIVAAYVLAQAMGSPR